MYEQISPDKSSHLLYKCPEEHRFQAAGNERKKERILIERMKERKQEKEKERREKERKIPANCRVDQLLVFNEFGLFRIEKSKLIEIYFITYLLKYLANYILKIPCFKYKRNNSGYTNFVNLPVYSNFKFIHGLDNNLF